MWYEFNQDSTDIIVKHPKKSRSEWGGYYQGLPKLLLIGLDDNPHLTFIKIDKNGTRHYKSDICSRCLGTGKVEYHSLHGGHIDVYECSNCKGIGKLKRAKTYKIHTHEYGKVLEKEYMDKQNDKFYNDNGINQKDNTTYVYLGNTYPIKDELKEKGAKYDKILGWHSEELIDGYPYIKVTVPIRIYPDKSMGYDYGYVNGGSEKENTFLDDLKNKIHEANKKYKVKSAK